MENLRSLEPQAKISHSYKKKKKSDWDRPKTGFYGKWMVGHINTWQKVMLKLTQ